MVRCLLVAAALFAWVHACLAEEITKQTITVGGRQRVYLIDVPPGGGQRPTIVMLHGLGGSGRGVATATHLAPLGEQNGFVTVFPNALVHQWNHFLPGMIPPDKARHYRPVGGTPDDAGFLKALLADLIHRGVTDPKRVYLGGFSAGGFMALRMVCDDSRAFAAVALISSSMPSALGQHCSPAAPIPILMEKGTADGRVPYRGGDVLDHSFTVWSAAEMTGFFTKLDGCGGQPDISHQTGANNVKIDVSDWADCSKGGPVTLYTFNGGIHKVYQKPPPARTLWDFFKPHAR